MTDETKPELSAEEKKAAISEYHKAGTAKDKAEVVKRYPFLAQVFAAANHAVAILFLLSLLCLQARAASTIVFGSMTAVNGTSNTVGFVAGNVSLPGGYFIIQNGGQTTTNELTINIQASLDNTNFVTVQTFSFATTNSQSGSFFPAYALQPIYFRGQAVATNSVNVGGTFIQ